MWHTNDTSDIHVHVQETFMHYASCLYKRYKQHTRDTSDIQVTYQYKGYMWCTRIQVTYMYMYKRYTSEIHIQEVQAYKGYKVTYMYMYMYKRYKRTMDTVHVYVVYVQGWLGCKWHTNDIHVQEVQATYMYMYMYKWHTYTGTSTRGTSDIQVTYQYKGYMRHTRDTCNIQGIQVTYMYMYKGYKWYTCTCTRETSDIQYYYKGIHEIQVTYKLHTSTWDISYIHVHCIQYKGHKQYTWDTSDINVQYKEYKWHTRYTIMTVKS